MHRKLTIQKNFILLLFLTYFKPIYLSPTVKSTPLIKDQIEDNLDAIPFYSLLKYRIKYLCELHLRKIG